MQYHGAARQDPEGAGHDRHLEYVPRGDREEIRCVSRHREPVSRELLSRVRNRDEEALNTFFDLFFDRAYGYVCRLIRNPDDAEDVTQVAFMKIHRAVHTLDVERDPASWVFAVVANTVRDYWRSKRYRQSQVERPIEGTTLAGGVTAEHDQEARDTARILETALEGLSEKLRMVVLLRDYEDLTYEQVAAVLGIAEAAARKRHSRALAELRRALDRASRPRSVLMGPEAVGKEIR
jgi:RNA polymerase sigma-70 factor (ECF subfamily)